MAMKTPDFSKLLQSLRCGGVIDREALAMESVAAAQASPSGLFLSLHASDEEIRRFESDLVPVTTRLTVIPSPAEVMYAVFSVQSAALQWRHVVPLCDEDARRWLEDIIAQQCVSLACNVTDRDQLTVMQRHGAWPQSESLLRLAEDWPELADEDKLVDLAAVLTYLTEPSVIQSGHPAYTVNEVRVISHSNWLLDYLEKARTRRFAADVTAYASDLH